MSSVLKRIDTGKKKKKKSLINHTHGYNISRTVFDQQKVYVRMFLTTDEGDHSAESDSAEWTKHTLL
jgi:hypothetical protein